MACHAFLEEAISVTVNAVEEERNKNYEAAFRLFQLSIGYFTISLKRIFL